MHTFMGRVRTLAILLAFFMTASLVRIYATPSTHIWAPSTDIQPYKKVHVTSDFYFPTTGKGTTADNYDQHNYVLEVYGLTFSLLSDKPEENALGKLWQPMGKVMAETGFDYKKGLGSVLDSYPWYFHVKAGVPEDAYFKYMPAFAAGVYDVGTRRNKTNNDLWYVKAAKTVALAGINVGRFSAGYFWGNGRLLRDKDGLRDNAGPLVAWERTMSELTDRLWLCVEYQGTQSSYGALNAGFAWKFTPAIAAIVGYDIYNNRNLTDTLTLQVDIDW